MMKLEGRVALVTGASRGIGLAIADRLAYSGARVAILARGDDVEDVAARIADTREGALVRGYSVDLTDLDRTRAVVAEIEETLGPVDILVNNAGIAESASLKATTDELWDRMMDLNVRVPYALTRLLLPGMMRRGHGRIVNMASSASRKAYRYTTAYTAGKHALLGMTRAFSKEGVGHGVTVNAICPGYVDTEMTQRTIANIVERTNLSEKQALEALLCETPAGRLVQPDEIAAAVVGLMPLSAGSISGQAIGIDGGEVEG